MLTERDILTIAYSGRFCIVDSTDTEVILDDLDYKTVWRIEELSQEDGSVRYAVYKNEDDNLDDMKLHNIYDSLPEATHSLREPKVMSARDKYAEYARKNRERILGHKKD